MKLDEFISNVLQDINKGLAGAKEQTGRKYSVQVSDSKGVHFDVAVTSSNSSGTAAEGSAKVGFVQVLGAGVGAKLEDKKENSVVSRIQFTIYIPSRTQQEEEVSTRLIQEQNDQAAERWEI